MTVDFLGGWITWLTTALAAVAGLVSWLVVLKVNSERKELFNAMEQAHTAALEAEIEVLKARLSQNERYAPGKASKSSAPLRGSGPSSKPQRPRRSRDIQAT